MASFGLEHVGWGGGSLNLPLDLGMGTLNMGQARGGSNLGPASSCEGVKLGRGGRPPPRSVARRPPRPQSIQQSPHFPPKLSGDSVRPLVMGVDPPFPPKCQKQKMDQTCAVPRETADPGHTVRRPEGGGGVGGWKASKWLHNPRRLGDPHVGGTGQMALSWGTGGGGWHEALVLVCFPVARLLASRHRTSRPSVGPNVFWLCQQSPWMTCPV